MSDVVSLTQVDKTFGEFPALVDFNLQLHEGEILGLLGHNGAGKTTCMKLILGVITPSHGDVRLFGQSPTGAHADQLRRQMGYLPENVSFYQQLSGREVLTYFARLKGVQLKQVSELLERVGILFAADRRVKTYSKGMRQRLGLAQALLGQPRLLLLDEPTTGLDPAATAEFYCMLDELRKQGTTVLLSSHVLPGVERHIDRAAILGQGRLLAIGSLAQLREHAQLPLHIRARGDWSKSQPPQLSAIDGLQQHRINGTVLELTGPEEAKMQIVRVLSSSDDVTDIEILPPSLDALYAYFSGKENAL